MDTETLAKKEPKVAEFLTTHFHKDVTLVQKAVTDFLEGASLSEKKQTIKMLREFIQSTEYSMEDKEDFVSASTAYLLQTHPMEWLQKIAKQIEEDVEKS